MKLLLCLLVICLIGLSQGRNVEEGLHEHVLKRIARAANDMYIVQMEALLLHQCEANNHVDLQDDLQTSMSEMTQCLKRKTLFMVTKEEYLRHIEECSEDTISKTKRCLNDNQQYFPDLLLGLAKSLVRFLYDNYDTLPELARCQSNLNEYSARVKYHQCLLAAARDTNDSQTVPENKDDFCRSFTVALECFPKHLKDVCTNTESMNKFTKEYVEALRSPCASKETDPYLN